MSGYAFHPDAFADLDEIWEYIAQDNVDAADRVLGDIHSTLTLLAGSPQIGHRRPDLTTRPLRFYVARDQYLVAYARRSTIISMMLRRLKPASPMDRATTG